MHWACTCISVLTTPLTRPRSYISVTTNIKEELHDLDDGRCLITRENTPTASQQVVHVLDPRFPLDRLKARWRTPNLDLNTTSNLITLRADWCRSFLDADWMLVPTKSILKKILHYDNSTFEDPYPGFKWDEPQEYMFIPFSTFRKRHILRLGSDAGKRKQKAKVKQSKGIKSASVNGMQKKKIGIREDMVDIRNGEATLHITPFAAFPLLHSHVHPFYAIDNGMDKMHMQDHFWTDELGSLYFLMKAVNRIWSERYSTSGRHSDEKRLKHKNGPIQAFKDAKVYDTRRRTLAEAKKRRLGVATPVQEFSTPLLNSVQDEEFLFDDDSKVVAWASAVAAAGPPDEDVV